MSALHLHQPGRHRPRRRSICILFVLLSALLRPGTTHGDESDPLVLLVQTLTSTTDTGVQAALLKGILSGLEGRRNVPAPAGWMELRRLLAQSDSEAVRERAAQLSQIFGDSESLARALAMLNDTSADAAQRRATLSLLLNQQNKQAAELLPALLDDPQISLDAIRGFAIVENKAGPSLLLQRYPKLEAPQQRAVIETLASRKVYATALLQAIEDKVVTRDDVPAQVARTMQQLLGTEFTAVFGEVRQIATDREQLLSKYKALCSTDAVEAADPGRGRAIFQKTCAACHTLYGTGGSVGPDLTGSNRANLEYILLNSVDPSYDVPDAYKTVSVVTVDGRVVNGVLAEEDAARIVLKTAEQPRVVIAREDIDERVISAKSMMPDGQLDKMKPQEVLDLIRYLRTTEQVELPQ